MIQDIELRWVERSYRTPYPHDQLAKQTVRVLQFRKLVYELRQDKDWAFPMNVHQWTDWQDVPTVKEPT